MKKILLIQPTTYAPGGDLVRQSRLFFPGLALPLLAALTPKPWQVEICYETIEEIPWETEAEIVGIGSMGHGVHRSLDIAREFRRRGKHVVLGGYMVSLLPQEALKYAHAVVVGDAEISWPRLIREYEAGGGQGIYQDRVENLDSLPLPRYDLVISKKIGPYLPVQAGRGCPHTCSFCSVYCLYQQRYLPRPIDQVLRDLEEIRRLGYKRFLLLDDNIAANPGYLYDLAQAIRPLGMKWMSQCSLQIAKRPDLLQLLALSGCETLSFGLESLSQESLDAMGKAWARAQEYTQWLSQIRQAGIGVSTEMVLGGEGDTLETFEETYRFIMENRIPVPRFYILTPIPGTQFYQEMREQGRLVEEDYTKYDGARAIHQPLNMSPDELTWGYWRLYDQLFSLPSIRQRLRGSGAQGPLYWMVNLHYRRHIKRRIPPNIF